MTSLVFGARVMIGVVFLVAAVTKLAAFGAFVRSVPFVARAWARPVAVAAVGSELLVVALLTTAATTATGLLLATGLGAALTAVVAAQVARGVRAPCACFGRSRLPVSRRHVVRNACLTAFALAGLIATPGADLQRRPAVAGAVALVAALIVIVSDEVTDLFTAGHQGSSAAARSRAKSRTRSGSR